MDNEITVGNTLAFVLRVGLLCIRRRGGVSVDVATGVAFFVLGVYRVEGTLPNCFQNDNALVSRVEGKTINS